MDKWIISLAFVLPLCFLLLIAAPVFVSCSADDDDDGTTDDDCCNDDIGDDDDDIDDDVEDDNDNDDDDTDDDVDDDTDDDVDDDTDNITLFDDVEYESCAEVPQTGLGETIDSSTLECSGQAMQGGPDFEWDVFMTLTELTAVVIEDQETLDYYIDPAFQPCPVDFDAKQVLMIVDFVPDGLCATIEICNVYENEQRRTAVVYYYHCYGGPTDWCSPLHFVTVNKSTLPVEFYVYRRNDNQYP